MPSNAPLDPQYIDAIRGFEGYSPGAAWDYKQSSSGYGTKAQPGDENLPPDQLKAVHEQRFQAELGKAAAHVDSVNPDLPPGARAALIDLTYNAGPGWAKSGLGDLVRAGDLQGAQQRLLEYNKAGGEVLPGLAKRRQTAAGWFGGEQPAQPQAVAQNAPVSPAANPMAVPGQPLNLAPPTAPIFAPQPQQAAPQQPGAMSGSAPGEMAAMQPAMGMQPIFAAPRKQVDLRSLRAALQAAQSRPIFGQG